MTFTTGKPLFDPARSHRVRNEIKHAHSEARIKKIDQQIAKAKYEATMRMYQKEI